MSRLELVRQMVLSEISDDYEEPSHVYGNVAERARACGISITQMSVEKILLELVEQGFARAYDLKGSDAVELTLPSQLDTIGGYYFGFRQWAYLTCWHLGSLEGGHSMTKEMSFPVGFSLRSDRNR